jgi:hypothetical protein
MNIRKGLLRLTVVLSVLVGTMIPLCQEWFFAKSEVDIDLPQNWKRMSIQEKLNGLDGLLSKKATFPLVSEIKQLSIRRQLKKMIVGKQDEVLRDGFGYSFGFRFYVGWEELSLLGLMGFGSVWMIYGLVRVVPSLIPHSHIIHFPSTPLDRPVESLNFPVWGEPVDPASRLRITIFGFLALEEGSKRPRKPGAAWID